VCVVGVGCSGPAPAPPPPAEKGAESAASTLRDAPPLEPTRLAELEGILREVHWLSAALTPGQGAAAHTRASSGVRDPTTTLRRSASADVKAGPEFSGVSPTRLT